MLDYSQLETLATVLRLGSFEAAAQHLHVTQSAVSQRIRQLEERIGAPLVQRGTPCVGTETGKRLARHAQEVALMEARVTGAQPDPLARLRIAVNADSLGTWVLEALADVPDQLYEIVVDDQDHSSNWLRRGEVSAAITAQERPPQGCSSIPLGVMVYVASASPEFMQKYLPQPVDKSSLEAAPMLVFNKKDALQDIWIKQNFGVIHRKKSHTIPSTEGFVTAARLGLGWGMNPQVLVDEFLADGTLVRLVDNSDLPVPLFWQSPRHLTDSLAPITDAIRRVAAKNLPPVDK
ncbi:LysR family transcriptional regulator ArgP [Thalassovita mediterranea]|jgi:LysR family transcriptional regulator (chromosome initiation inhibitor)|uniref:Putative HTH-type transcriptional regulatorc/MT2039 n=1 Tax=Thalassovita mediterranea TaxID=340021 RepID=A0A0P1H4Z9_9RHOB|nr:LysR family transcriptional regulator ArgP [Thalassovita mediterranea]CUH85856.1 putative HTH-type transcriptional regulatorc/MT2039 [Thalassovita mediterranea]SIS32661.1 transcriptional regulator, LysR family [Thalassovita mediterranea]